MPDRIIDKRKLGFFRSATDAWLRSQIEGRAASYLLAERPRYADFLDAGAVRKLVDDQRKGENGNIHLLLAILMLEVWLESYLPRATRDARADDAIVLAR